MIFKRGRVYWFEFWKDGKRYRQSTGVRNQDDARDIESAFRVALAKGDVGITEHKPAPTLKEFEKTFTAWIDQDRENVRTREFYKTSYARLLAFKPLADARLDTIDEAIIERFKSATLREVGKTTVNRYLSTLRKALRYASRKLRMFDRLPVITMYPDERQRDYIFSDADYKNWLAIAPEPLRSASVLARNAGICRGEMLALERDCIHLSDEDGGLFGTIEIKRGLKRKERRRTLPITREMRDALLGLLARSHCPYVFTAMEYATRPLSPWTLEDQLRRTREALKLNNDAGLHTLRHTCLTEMGRNTDRFTLQKIAGHARITTTQRYVHPQQDAITAAFTQKVPTKVPTVVHSPEKEPVIN